MSKNEVATNNGSKISTKGAQLLVNEVHEGLKLLSKGYLSIMPQVNKLYDTKGFKALGYKNFDEMCLNEFGMSHGTTVGIRKVWQMIGSVSADNSYTIPAKYSEFGYTQLLLIANDKAKFEEAGIKPFEVFTPDMKIKDMKKALELALEEKAKEQDESAIDTEEATTEEATTEEATTEEATTEEATTEEAKKMSIFDKLGYIHDLAIECAEECDLNNWLTNKKERAMFDAIISNAKDIVKALNKESKGK